MTKRALAIFTAITAVLVVLAFVTYEGSGPTGGAEPGERFFPELEAQLDSVREIRVTHQGESFSVRRTEDGWGVTEHSGYPANTEAVVRALREIAALRKFEPKTSNPERYEELEVDDPDNEDADSRLVTLIDQDGEELASIIIGKENTTNQILGRELVYVRLPNEEQSWLAIGNPAVDGDSVEWTQKQVMDIDIQRVRRYSLSRPDGGSVTVSRPSHTSASDWAIENPPAGREPKQQTVIAGPASALDPVNLRAVRPVDEIDFDADAAGTAEILTFDGIVVRATLAERDENIWVRFEARFDESRAWEGEPPEGSRIKSAEEARAEAEELNRRVENWAYRVDSTSQRYMRFTMEDLLQEQEEEEQQGGRNRDGGPAGRTRGDGASR